MTGLAGMVAHMRSRHVRNTFVALTAQGGIVGTVALLEEDLRPWVACRWVAPQHRRKGVGRRLVDHATDKTDGSTCHLWCYAERERDMYARWGFELLEEARYRDEQPAYVMRRAASSHATRRHHPRAVSM